MRSTISKASGSAIANVSPDAHRRLASYRSREDGDFAFAGELAEKRRQLAEVEKALASDVEGSGASAIAA